MGVSKLAPEASDWLSTDDLPSLAGKARSASMAKLPSVPQEDIDTLLNNGIVHGQGRFQNNTASPLSYAVFDGTPLPMAHVQIVDRPSEELSSIELFSDGYMAPPAGTAIADWEASFAHVEALDPTKTGAYPCPKGSTKDRWFDDRTIMSVRLDERCVPTAPM